MNEDLDLLQDSLEQDGLNKQKQPMPVSGRSVFQIKKQIENKDLKNKISDKRLISQKPQGQSDS